MPDMRVTSLELHQKLGQMIDKARFEPVVVTKHDREHVVIVSAEHYAFLLQAARKARLTGSLSPEERALAVAAPFPARRSRNASSPKWPLPLKQTTAEIRKPACASDRKPSCRIAVNTARLHFGVNCGSSCHLQGMVARARHEVLKDTSGFLKFRSHQHQFDLPKRRKIAIGGNRRVFQPSAATARAFQKSLLVKAALMNEEGVWMRASSPYASSADAGKSFRLCVTMTLACRKRTVLHA